MSHHSINNRVQIPILRRPSSNGDEPCSLGDGSSKRFVQHQTERIDVCTLVDRVATRALLRCSVEEVSQAGIGLSLDGSVKLFLSKLSNAEIGNHQSVCGLLVKDVLWLQVAMCDVSEMSCLHAVEDLGEPRQGPVWTW